MPRHCAGSRSCLPHPSKKKLPWPDLAFHSCILPAERFLHQLCRPPHKPKTVPLFHGTLVESDLRQLAPQHPCDISIQDIPPVAKAASTTTKGRKNNLVQRGEPGNLRCRSRRPPRQPWSCEGQASEKSGLDGKGNGKGATGKSTNAILWKGVGMLSGR